MTTAWENKILTYKLAWKGFDYKQMEQDLNDYGREGWEVVQTIIPALGAGQTLEIAVVIKRPAVG
ncbi:hypothetical protein GCM10010413_04130 [Promicromonospora sukumoe]|uniref:DUF4177 domain-containing protein n=1 Tax=Promicromonospora sukumoe TaxID=88382 RepID=A0A7W3PHB0_9MICO|nr:DUF4177 domain-containing protein [Promicromonospora sukumoe]MBA8811661.1 hypothetical protein [Promicromonospora sukumoe]